MTVKSKQNKLLAFIIAKRYLLLLILLIIAELFTNAYIVFSDQIPLSNEQGIYYYISLRYYDTIRYVQPLEFAKVSPDNKGPLFFLISVPFYFLFGTGADIAVMANMVFMVIAIVAAYLIGKEITFSDKGAFFSAFFVSMIPGFFAWSRLYYLEFSLMSLMLAFLYSLIKSDRFTNRKYTILASAVCIAGELIKAYFILAVFIPIIFILARALRPKLSRTHLIMKRLQQKQKANILIFAALIIVVSAPFYIVHFRDVVLQKMIDLMLMNIFQPTNFNHYSFREILVFYITRLWQNGLINIIVQGVFLISCAYYFLNMLQSKKKGFWDEKILTIIFALIGVYIFFTFAFPIKHPKYMTMFVPAIGLQIGISMHRISEGKNLRYIAWICLLLMLGNFAMMNWIAEPGSFFIPFDRQYTILQRDTIGMVSASQQNWKVESSLATINESITDEKEQYEILFIDPLFYYDSYIAYSYQDHLPFNINIPMKCTAGGYGSFCDRNYSRQIEDSDFVVILNHTKNKYTNIFNVDSENAEYDQFRDLFFSMNRSFRYVSSVSLPEDLVMLIYAKKQ